MEINAITIIYIFLIVWVITNIGMVKWVSKSRPDKNITEKYSKKTVILSQLPFGSKWKAKVDENDIVAMVQYQHKVKVWYSYMLITVLFFFIYMFSIIFFVIK